MRILGGVSTALLLSFPLAPAASEEDSSGYGPPEVNLLRLIDPEKDAVRGTWTCDGTLLITPPEWTTNRLQIPYEPPAEYDLRVRLRRDNPSVHTEAIHLGMAHARGQFLAIIDGWKEHDVTGLDMVDGKKALHNTTTLKGIQRISSERVSTIVCKVRKTGVTVILDGNPIIEWRGSLHRLSLDEKWKVPHTRSLLIGCADRFHVSELTLRPISGMGKRIR